MNQENNKKLSDWLVLHQAQLDVRTVFRLLEIFGSVSNIVHAEKKVLSEIGLSNSLIESLKNSNWSEINAELQWIENKENHIVCFDDPNYPSLLKEIADPPLLLYVRGNKEILHSSQLAIVGSRNPSPPGEKNAAEFAYALSQCGLTITSGLAIGIDTAAHRGALKSNSTTIAVLGSGLNNLYPKQNSLLAEQIIEKNGALISEFSLNAPPQPFHFPQRNRIISGLSLGTLVVEAALNSGSLITARLSAEQGREVFAIPGSIHNPLARGCHELIRNGVKLVENVQDVLEELGQFVALSTGLKRMDEIRNKNESRSKLINDNLTCTQDNLKLDPTCQILLDYVLDETTTVDQIVSITGQSPASVSGNLLLLEVNGYIKSIAGGYIRVK